MAAGRLDLTRLLGGEIGDDEADDARLGRVLDKSLDPVGQDRVEVAHEEQRHFHAAGPQLHGHLQTAGHRHPLPERQVRGPLDGGSVGQGVGEGDAQLHQVGPASHGGFHQIHALMRCGVPQRQVRYQRRPPFRLRPRKGFRDTS